MKVSKYSLLLALAIVCLTEQQLADIQLDNVPVMSSFARMIGTCEPLQETAKGNSSIYDMTQRLNQKTLACKHFQNLTKRQLRVNGPIIVHIKANNLSYCGVGKAGGTFFKQLFFILINGEQKSKQLENLSRLDVHATINKYQVQFSEPTWKHARLLTLARNPYSRLYSAYIDRVTLPVTTPALRSGAFCKYDVTFEDFLKYVVIQTDKGIIDPHWSPIFYIYKSCSVTWTYIIKQETFTNDIKYLLDTLQLLRNKTDAINRIMKESRTNWTISGIVKDVIGIGSNDFQKPECIGHYGLMKQLWKAFQVQGFIDEKIQLTEKMFTEIRNLTSSTVDTIIHTVLILIERNPLSREKKKLQRGRYLVNAYKEVKYGLIQAIQRVFKPDFDMFGYYYEPPLAWK